MAQRLKGKGVKRRRGKEAKRRPGEGAKRRRGKEAKRKEQVPGIHNHNFKVMVFYRIHRTYSVNCREKSKAQDGRFFSL
ncbi:hypothetical protein D3A96_06580 [Robertkochia marina]|nr:hypothetical protein D3A96_06580 [Robertkochia marina]